MQEEQLREPERRITRKTKSTSNGRRPVTQDVTLALVSSTHTFARMRQKTTVCSESNFAPRSAERGFGARIPQAGYCTYWRESARGTTPEFRWAQVVHRAPTYTRTASTSAAHPTASLDDFLGLIDGTNTIRYWDAAIENWTHITTATEGEDYTLDYMTEGDLTGNTVLTVTAVAEPSTLALAAIALAGLLIRRLRSDR